MLHPHGVKYSNQTKLGIGAKDFLISLAQSPGWIEMENAHKRGVPGDDPV